MPRRASGVVRTDMPPGVHIGGRLRWLGRGPWFVECLIYGGAAVVLDELVAHRIGVADRQCAVREAFDLHVGNGVVAAFAPAKYTCFVEHGRMEDLRAGARDCIAHAGAPAETRPG